MGIIRACLGLHCGFTLRLRVDALFAGNDHCRRHAAEETMVDNTNRVLKFLGGLKIQRVSTKIKGMTSALLVWSSTCVSTSYVTGYVGNLNRHRSRLL